MKRQDYYKNYNQKTCCNLLFKNNKNLLCKNENCCNNYDCKFSTSYPTKPFKPLGYTNPKLITKNAVIKSYSVFSLKIYYK